MSNQNLILRVVAKLLIPFILLFALYVQFHGESGPGGGFQAGVIFASAFILYALVFGADKARRVAPEWLVSTLMALGVLIYAGTGAAALLYGANFLDYGVFTADFVTGQLLGIFLVEFGVGITVAAVMVSIYLAFAERRN
jgi:multicomponent Na+:H+ antiporter subunit B